MYFINLYRQHRKDKLPSNRVLDTCCLNSFSLFISMILRLISFWYVSSFSKLSFSINLNKNLIKNLKIPIFFQLDDYRKKTTT